MPTTIQRLVSLESKMDARLFAADDDDLQKKDGLPARPVLGAAALAGGALGGIAAHGAVMRNYGGLATNSVKNAYGNLARNVPNAASNAVAGIKTNASSLAEKLRKFLTPAAKAATALSARDRLVQLASNLETIDFDIREDADLNDGKKKLTVAGVGTSAAAAGGYLGHKAVKGAGGYKAVGEAGKAGFRQGLRKDLKTGRFAKRSNMRGVAGAARAVARKLA